MSTYYHSIRETQDDDMRDAKWS